MRRYWQFGFVLCLLFIGKASAQDALEPQVARTIALSASGPVVLTYNGRAGEILTVVSETSDNIDTVLELRAPNHRRLVYVDDRAIAQDDGSITVFSSAVIQSLLLPEDGLYQILVNSFNGVSIGQARISISLTDAPAATVLKTPNGWDIKTDLIAGRAYEWALIGRVGDSFQITARDMSSHLDPILRLETNNGEIIAFNDDHQSADTRLNTLDSRLQVTLSTDDTLWLKAGDFWGRPGQIAVTIERIRP